MMFEYGPKTMLFLLILVAGLTLRVFYCYAGNSAEPKGTVLWQPAFEQNGNRIIPGLIKTNSGAIQIKWVIDIHGNAKLVTLIALGAGELPPREQRLLPMVLENEETTLLFQEWFPAMNVKEPSQIRIIAAVPTTDLFLVLNTAKPPSVSLKGQKPQTINWENSSVKNGITYLPGNIKAPFGTLNIAWKKEEGRIAELISFKAPGAGELPPVESKLYLWKDSSKTTVICRERRPQLNQSYVSYLYPLVKVKSSKLMDGFKRLN